MLSTTLFADKNKAPENTYVPPFVFFANGANGLSFIDEILAASVGGDHPGANWQNCPRYDAAWRKSLKVIIEKGATEPLRNYLEERRRKSTYIIAEIEINFVGYRLLEINKFDDAILVLTQNISDFPQSWNAWDSLAEAYLTKGDNETAIKFVYNILSSNALTSPTSYSEPVVLTTKRLIYTIYLKCSLIGLLFAGTLEKF